MIRVTLTIVAFFGAFAAASPCGFAADPADAGRQSVDYSIQQAGYMSAIDDGAERYASGVESWWDDLCDCVRERRLLGYKRSQKKHRKFLYPECPPYCSPTFGYHHTQWRPFPGECEYVWSSAPGEVVYPTPAAPPAMFVPAPAQLPAAPAELREAPPYFPEEPPLIQPAEPAVPPPPPPEPPLESAGDAFLPARPAEPATAFEAPALLQIN